MARSAFKMKGSPMQRNFGIGSPMRRDEKEEQVTTAAGPDIGVVKSKAMIRLESNKPAVGSPGYDAWLSTYNQAKAENLATAQ